MRQELENWIAGDNLTINTSRLIYITDPSSVVIDTAKQTCPSGREILLSNNFIYSKQHIYMRFVSDM